MHRSANLRSCGRAIGAGGRISPAVSRSKHARTCLLYS
ncbi:hypothetical protein [Azospirillum endophyticum]